MRSYTESSAAARELRRNYYGIIDIGCRRSVVKIDRAICHEGSRRSHVPSVHVFTRAVRTVQDMATTLDSPRGHHLTLYGPTNSP